MSEIKIDMLTLWRKYKGEFFKINAAVSISFADKSRPPGYIFKHLLQTSRNDKKKERCNTGVQPDSKWAWWKM